VRSVHTAQGNDFQLILTVKMETRRCLHWPWLRPHSRL